MLLTAAIDTWIEGLHRAALTGGLSPVTVKNYSRDVGALCAFLPATVNIEQVGYEQVDAFFDSYAVTPDARHTRTQAPEGKATASLNRLYASLNVFFTDAQKRGWVAHSPMPETYLARGKKRTTENPRRKSIGLDGVEKLLAQPLPVRDEFLIRVMLETGCRVGELCAANRTDLARGADGAWLELNETKSRTPRSVPLSTRTYRLYEAYEGTRPAPQPRPGKPDTLRDSERALILTTRGRRITPRDVQNVLRKASMKAGVDVTPHGLRHTAATVLLESGADLHTVRDLLGHSNISVTSLYLDTRKEDIGRTVRSSPLAG